MRTPEPLQPVFLLAQGLGQLDVPDPAGLPAPSALERYVFESPMLLAAALITAAIITVVIFNARGKRRHGLLVGLVLVLSAAGVWVASALVQTPREALKLVARTLVASVAAGDSAALNGALAPDAALYSYFSPSGMARDEVLSTVETRFRPGGEYQVREYAILTMQAAIDSDDSGRVQLKVRVVPEATRFPVLSWWLLEMQRQPNGEWRARGIAPLSISGVSNASGR